jgi:hypothetical protein
MPRMDGGLSLWTYYRNVWNKAAELEGGEWWKQGFDRNRSRCPGAFCLGTHNRI